jgi:hypothetical protein
MSKDAYRYMKNDSEEVKITPTNDKIELDLSAWDLASDGSDRPHVVKFYINSVSGDTHDQQILFVNKLNAELCAQVLQEEEDADAHVHAPHGITIEPYEPILATTFDEWAKEYKR